MAPLSKLTLTSYRRTQPHRDPVEERRSKTLAALEQQKLVLAAALNGQEHIVTKPGWAHDGDGNLLSVLTPLFNSVGRSDFTIQPFNSASSKTLLSAAL